MPCSAQVRNGSGRKMKFGGINNISTLLASLMVLNILHNTLQLPSVSASRLLTAGDENEFYNFPPPENFFADYWEPPPIDEPQEPYGHPDSPGQHAEWPLPPPVPSPPSPQPPAAVPPLRLLNSTDGVSGVVQMWDEEARDWGALCVFKSEFADSLSQYGNFRPDMDVAKLVCKQLHLPYMAAQLVSPELFMPLAKAKTLRAKALGTWPDSLCPNALDARSVYDCNGFNMLTTLAPSCMAVVRAVPNKEYYAKVNYVPMGVACRGVAPPAVPPIHDAPLPPFAGKAVNYTTRIVDLKTGAPLSPLDRFKSGVRGRLHVLLQGPTDTEPRWGGICRGNYMSDDIAQFACRANGFPWRTASVEAGARRPGLNPRDGTPIHLILMDDCRLQAGGLACALTANYTDAQSMLKSGAANLLSGMRGMLKWALDICDPVKGRGHQADVVVRCEDVYMPPAPPPSVPLAPVPSVPPSPPLIIRNDLQIRTTEYFTNVYGVEFGVRLPGYPSTVWGTACYDSDNINVRLAAANAICNQLTSGAQPYGAFWYLVYIPPVPGIPPESERLSTPFVVDKLDCTHAPDGIAPNISYCEAKLMDVVPTAPSNAPKCNWLPWSDRLLSCMPNRYYYVTPSIATIRLAGGSNSSYGRLEILIGQQLNRGWGTVCAEDFKTIHAQAVCRDLGRPWTQAAVRRASEVPGLHPPPSFIHMDTVFCHDNYNPAWFGESNFTGEMSFIRDCQRGYPGGVLPTCEHDADVVVVCAGEAGERPPQAASPPQSVRRPGPPPVPHHPVPVPTATGCYGGYGFYGAYVRYGCQELADYDNAEALLRVAGDLTVE